MQKLNSYDMSGPWIRFDRYAITNGVLSPAEGAELAGFDPWAEYRRNAGIYRSVKQPYQAFLELARTLEDLFLKKKAGARDATKSRGLQEEINAAIIGFCERWGLLGILPVFARQIVTLPVKQHEERTEDEADAAVTRHFRSGGFWYSQNEDPPKQLKNSPELGVQWMAFDDLFPEPKDLEDIRRYYPSMAENQDFRPMKPNNGHAFFRIYGEPVAEFAEVCIRFARAVTALSQPEDVPARHWWETMHLNGLAQGCAPAFKYNSERGKMEEVRESPGLLASFALMYLWDRAAGRSVIKCKNCSAWLVSNDPRAGYCSTTCRNTAQSRRYRASKESKG